jgi:hypothetical protein
MSTLRHAEKTPVDFRVGYAIAFVVTFGKQPGPPFPRTACALGLARGPSLALCVDEHRRPVFVATDAGGVPHRVTVDVDASTKVYVFCQLAPTSAGTYRLAVYVNGSHCVACEFDADMGGNIRADLSLGSDLRNRLDAAITMGHLSLYSGVVPDNDRNAIATAILAQHEIGPAPMSAPRQQLTPEKAVAIVVDASVYIAAGRPEDFNHKPSLDLIDLVDSEDAAKRVVAHAPATFMFEIFANALRGRKGGMGRTAKGNLHSVVTGHDVTAALVREFLAWHQETFGQDAAPFVNAGDLPYLAVAQKVPATLITNDSGALRYDGQGVMVSTPEQFLADYGRFLAMGGMLRFEAERAARDAVLTYARSQLARPDLDCENPTEGKKGWRKE